MNKPGLISKTAELLRANGVKKAVSVPDGVFYVVDDNGNKKKFTVSVPDREVNYTIKDVSNILDGILAVTEDCIKHGEPVHIYGLGALRLKKRAAGMMKLPDKDEWHEVPEHYIPYFKVGEIIKQAARLYEENLKMSNIGDIPAPVYDACESEDYE